MQDLKNNIEPALSLNPAARTSSTNGSAVDLQGYESALVLVHCGALTDGTHTPSVEHSDASGSGYAAVAAADLVGTLAACTANAIQAVSYIGAKRYIRVVLTVAGAPSTGAIVEAMVARGNERHAGGVAV
jgi:hypothetical protein